MGLPVNFHVYKGVKFCSSRGISPGLLHEGHLINELTTLAQAICLSKTSAGAPLIPGGSIFPP
jgi:hypothetical protein